VGPRARNETRRMNLVRFELETRSLTNFRDLRWLSFRVCSAVPDTKCNVGLWQGNIITVIVAIRGGGVGSWHCHCKESLLQGVMCTRRWESGAVFISNDVGGLNSEWLGGVGWKVATVAHRLLIARWNLSLDRGKWG
jgi:hypothetical protein